MPNLYLLWTWYRRHWGINQQQFYIVVVSMFVYLGMSHILSPKSERWNRRFPLFNRAITFSLKYCDNWVVRVVSNEQLLDLWSVTWTDSDSISTSTSTQSCLHILLHTFTTISNSDFHLPFLTCTCTYAYIHYKRARRMVNCSVLLIITISAVCLGWWIRCSRTQLTHWAMQQ